MDHLAGQSYQNLDHIQYYQTEQEIVHTTGVYTNNDIHSVTWTFKHYPEYNNILIHTQTHTDTSFQYKCRHVYMWGLFLFDFVCSG